MIVPAQLSKRVDVSRKQAGGSGCFGHPPCLFVKTGVTNCAQAAAYAKDRGLA
jgi:hypothetical protein